MLYCIGEPKLKLLIGQILLRVVVGLVGFSVISKLVPSIEHCAISVSTSYFERHIETLSELVKTWLFQL